MEDEIILRHPELSDGPAIFDLVKTIPEIDTNSQKYYYLMCNDFGKSSLIAERGGELLGFVIGYITPEDEKCLLISQIVVAENARNKGMAGALLANLAQDWSGIITSIKTMITPSNKNAQALFNGFAEKMGHTVATSDFLKAKQFADKHEDEVLYTITL